MGGVESVTGWPGVLFRPGRSAAWLAALSMIGALAAERAVAQGLPLELGVGVSRNGSPPADLSDAGCAADVSWAPEGRVGLRLSPAIRLEGNVGVHLEQNVTCVDPTDVPPTGPFERTLRSVPDAGYPFLSTDARLSFEPATPAGAVWLRAFGGYGRMWNVSANYWLAGAGLVFGGRIVTVLEFEWNWFDLPFEEVTQSFQDGLEVGETTRKGRTSHSEFRIKAGFRFRI